MTPKWVVAVYIVTGIIMILLGVVKILIDLGLWPYTIGWLALGSVWLLVAFRYARHPLISWSHEIIEILVMPGGQTRRIQVDAVQSVEEKKWRGARLILREGKSIGLPLDMMSRKDRLYVVNSLQQLCGSGGSPQQVQKVDSSQFKG